ncbi:anaerobic ribonucleoside-triphosphate reductase activating protein [Candidatus Thiosymbion oneisti]|uniref:anaerobic ribonucleoside-triphosphate reductase activating protein n=1 Tax=Candidatus Thiosymbion oneisti TaxID=589554 RepID=UPI000AA8E339|nr:anaerobic ribonucleoside-triphosphate reductase activating protein [Candidatus Thiosymbion oneisti]
MTPAAQSLRIGGLTPMTTIDYPGELAAVVFCQGCPWRCRYCHNGHLLPPESEHQIPWSDMCAFLEKRTGLLDALVFSGGEPTLQAALPAAVKEARSMGFKIGLHTAGPYPDRLRRLLPFIDWVGLDIKALPADYPAVTGVPDSGERAWESLALLLDAGIALQVRTTVLPGWRDEPDLRPLADRLAAIGVRNHVLQRCRTESTLDPRLGMAGNPLSPRPLEPRIDTNSHE